MMYNLIGFNLDREKTRLQNRMAFGQDCAPVVALPKDRLPSDTTEDSDIDRFEEGNNMRC